MKIKEDPILKLGQLIKYYEENFHEKLWWKCAPETTPRFLFTEAPFGGVL